ncbi:substrate-binding domain-containing protein [Pelagibius sp. Alg239-R121]|uniref:substrate-binding domain-containing protein n=1 Tax=Pelagibius sp. Alg239-R121 TaxID=2993448 RepID=UPI0024A6EB13|nr:substrate-binding domain-containing protein [Pelagibius sp. Alg239-R121]
MKASGSYKVGLFIPTSGTAGIWGPSCRACAELAVAELNAEGGMDGRPISLTIVNAGNDPERVALEAEALREDGMIEAVVGMHTSDVREAIADRIAGSLPYVYTPLFEGGPAGQGVFCIGETPEQQLLPGLDWLSARFRLKRWFLLGNDYIWPRASHAAVHRHFRGGDRSIVGQAYLPFGTQNFAPVLERIRRAKPDGLLLSLVGDDCIRFNRVFARSRQAGKVIRFSCAVEENTLLGIGADSTDGLFAASGYFSTLDTAANGAFRERYHTRFGERGPMLNSIGEGLYEGLYFLRALSDVTQASDWTRLGTALPVKGPRGAVFQKEGRSQMPMYLAEARGHAFKLVDQLADE